MNKSKELRGGELGRDHVLDRMHTLPGAPAGCDWRNCHSKILISFSECRPPYSLFRRLLVSFSSQTEAGLPFGVRIKLQVGFKFDDYMFAHVGNAPVAEFKPPAIHLDSSFYIAINPERHKVMHQSPGRQLTIELFPTRKFRQS